MHVWKIFSRLPGSLLWLIAGGIVVWLGLQTAHRLPAPAPVMVPNSVSAAAESLPVVTVVDPERRPSPQTITLPASVEAIEKATLYAKVSGYVQWIRVDKGDQAKKGEVLALLEVPEVEKEYQSAQAAVAESQAEFDRAQADAKLKQVTYQRMQGVRDSEPTVVSPQEIDVARAASETAAGNARLAMAHLDKARAELGKLQVLAEFAKVRAPFDGVVTERFADPGALIQTGANSLGSPVVSLASIDQVRVYVFVPEVDVSQVNRGLAAKVRLDGFPGRVFAGKVTRFAGALDPQSRTMKTEFDLPNSDHRILPGMFGTVTLELSTDPNALFLPDQVVRQGNDGKKFVYTVENDRLRKVEITTGQDDGKMSQVFGLRGTEVVALSGVDNLQEGTSVKAVKSPKQVGSRGGR